MNNKKKQIIMLSLGVLLLIMAVGYASASTALRISGTASLEATWNVAITGISEGEATGSAYNRSTPTYTGTTATFDVGLKNIGDSMTYSVTVTNSGTIDAKLIQLNSGICDTTGICPGGVNETKFSIITSGIKEGDILKSGESKVFQVYVELPQYYYEIVNDEIPNFRISTFMGFEQSDNKKEYARYELNDRIMLTDGSIWRVFESSSNTDNVVKIIKESPINNSDLGETNTISEYNEYLNSNYKNTLSESIKENIVGDITIPKFATINSDSIYHIQTCDVSSAGDEDYIDNIQYHEVSDGTISNFLITVESRVASMNNGNYVGYVDNNLYWIRPRTYSGNNYDVYATIENTVMYVDDFSSLQKDNPYSCTSMQYNSLIINLGAILKKTSESTYTVRMLFYSHDEQPDIRPVMTINKDAIK